MDLDEDTMRTPIWRETNICLPTHIHKYVRKDVSFSSRKKLIAVMLRFFILFNEQVLLVVSLVDDDRAIFLFITF